MTHETLYILTYYAPHGSDVMRTVRTFTYRENAEEHANIVRRKNWQVESLREYRLVKEEKYES